MHGSSGEVAQASDLELAIRWRDGDREAGGELFSRYFDQVRGYFINAGNEKDHLDMTQNTFTRLTASVGNFRAESSFRTYLFSIARRVRFDHYRLHYKLKEHITDAAGASVEDYEGMTPSDAVTRLEEGGRLNACVRALAIDDREAVELHYWHGWKLKEIAQLFEVKEATIRGRMLRARSQLRACFAGQTSGLSRSDLVADLEQQLRLIGRELGIPGGRGSET